MQKGVAFQERELFQQRLTEAEIRALLRGRPAAEGFAWKSPTARALGVVAGQVPEEELIRLMQENPTLIRRPVLEVGERVLFGHDVRQWEEALTRVQGAG